MKNMFLLDSLRQVRATLNRFFAILIITALGVAFFAGLRATGPAMRQTGTDYLNEQDFMDIRVLSTAGFNEEDFEAIENTKGVQHAEETYSADVLAETEDGELAVRLYSLGGSLNRPQLTGGRLPESPGECLADAEFASRENLEIGDTVTFQSGTADPLSDTIRRFTYTITGITRSPMYLSYDRGTSTVGGGQAEGYFYIPESNFTLPVYTDVYLTAQGVDRSGIFGDAYIDSLKPLEDSLETVGKERAPQRYDEIQAEADEEITDGKREIADGYQELDDAEKELEDARVELADGKKEYADGVEEFDREMADGRKKLDDGRAEYNNGLAEYNDGVKAYEDGAAKLADGRAQYENGLAEYHKGLAAYEKEATPAKKKLDKAEADLNAAQKQYDDGMAALNQGKQVQGALSGALAAGNTPEALGTVSGIAAQIAGTQPDLAAVLNAYVAAPDDPVAAATAQGAVAQMGTTLSESEAQLAAAKKEIDKGWKEVDKGRAELEKGKKKLDGAKAELDAAGAELAAGEAASADGKDKLDSAKVQLDDAKRQLAKGEQELEDGRIEGEKKLADAKKEIEDGEKELADGEKEFAGEKADALVDLKDAEREIADAEADLADLEEPEWFILNNEMNAGFMSYKQDTLRLDSIAVIIPVFFFVLAAFVTMTSMTRLVESDRSYIGTMKSLGYGNGVIALRYLAYAVAASLSGGLLGLALGYTVLPRIIFGAYSSMYTLPALHSDFPYLLSFMSVTIAVLCAALPAYLVCMNSVHEKPSELMRPESPQSGKRVFLERIPFIWKRLSFLHKVTVRNLFRYKKRLIMTVVGVMGCTALMFAGFAINDAITGVIPKQYGSVFTYDMQVGFSSEDKAGLEKAAAEVTAQPGVESQLLLRQQPVDTAENGTLTSTILVVPQDPGQMDGFIGLHDRKGQTPIPLEDGSVVIAERLSTLLDVKAGDSILLRDADGKEAEVAVGGVTENYLSLYIYMTPGDYEKAFGEEALPNEGLYLLADGTNETALSRTLMDQGDVVSVSMSSESRGGMEKTIDALYIVVLVLVVSAGALIFVVLFSLISINLEERKRELATIKVLGFYDRELSNYIYRESNILTVIGVLLGLVNGIVLQRFILNTMETNFLMFSRDIMWQTFAYSAGLTAAFAFLVNLIMLRHFKKIDMISSLKSVD